MDDPQTLRKIRPSRDVSYEKTVSRRLPSSDTATTRDLTRTSASKNRNYRSRLSWSDYSNARSTASSTSNDDDQGDAKGLVAESSWWRRLSTTNMRKRSGSRFSWSDNSPSKTSVTSISEDESVPLAAQHTPKLIPIHPPPASRSTTASKLKSFGKRLSWTETKRSRNQQTMRPGQEDVEPGHPRSSEPLANNTASPARPFSARKRHSMFGKRYLSNDINNTLDQGAAATERHAKSPAIDTPTSKDVSPEAMPRTSISRLANAEAKRQIANKRHSWAGPGPHNENTALSEAFNGGFALVEGSPAQGQRVIIKRPSTVDRPPSGRPYSWSKINEERDRTLSILEEGQSSSSNKSPPNAAKPATSRPSTTNKLEAFKKRHSLSDYKQIRGRPFSSDHDTSFSLGRTWSPSTRSRGPSPPRRGSTSDRVRSFSKRLSLPNNIWVSSTELSSRSEDDNDSTTKIISSETLQLRRSNTVPLRSLPPQPAHSIPQSSPLLSLPTELLQLLPPYLPPSALVALRQTCSRLHTILGLLPHSSSSSLSRTSTFTFLLMLDRDNLTSYAPSTPPRLLCGQCQRFHPRSAFPAAHASLHPLHRSCRQLWLCPHKSYTHPRAAKFLRPPQDSNTLFITKNIDPCPRCRDSIRHRVASDPTNTILTTKIALLQRPTPLPKRGQAPDVFPVKDVSAALQTLSFRLCPHIRISDHQLLSRFCRVCLSTRSVKANGRCIQDCNSERLSGTGYGGGKCKGQCFKRGCNTGWMFQTRESLKPDASGRRQVWLVLAVWRAVGNLKIPEDDDAGTADEIVWDPEEMGDGKKDTLPEPIMSPGVGERDPAWLDHTVDAPERASMRKHWEQWNRGAGGGGKCLPDWSALLLLSDDGSFGFGVT